ncbi:MAG: cytochrome P460 family protein [Planctomycetota bacterium]
MGKGEVRKIGARAFIGGTCVALGAGVVAVMAGVGVAPDPAYELDGRGELVRPTDYRTWVYVGTPVTPNDMNDGKAPFPEHHNVYIDPVSYEHYKRTGGWREGTILLKELVSVGTKEAVSGNGYFQGEFIGLEASVKSRADFPDEPGNWAYFSFTNEGELGGALKSTAAAFPAASCNACHAASARDDFVFTQHYPVLRAAKGSRTNPENRAARPKTLGAAAAPMMEREMAAEPPAPNPQWQAGAETPGRISGTDVPTDQAALFEYLREFRYRDWETRESARHPSGGPHTQLGRPVRVYMNDTLARTMRSDRRRHREGATAIKEMYTADGRLEGWAVEIKTGRNSRDGDGWFWYEVTSTTDGSSPVAIGNGVPGCVSCHTRGGRDMVLSDWPLK